MAAPRSNKMRLTTKISIEVIILRCCGAMNNVFLLYVPAQAVQCQSLRVIY